MKKTLAFLILLLLMVVPRQILKAEKFDVKGFTGYEFGERYEDVINKLNSQSPNYDTSHVYGMVFVDVNDVLFQDKKFIDLTLGFSDGYLTTIDVKKLGKKDIPAFLIQKKNKPKKGWPTYELYREEGLFGVVDLGFTWELTISDYPINPKQKVLYEDITKVKLGQTEQKIQQWLESSGLDFIHPNDEYGEVVVDNFVYGNGQKVKALFTFYDGRLTAIELTSLTYESLPEALINCLNNCSMVRRRKSIDNYIFNNARVVIDSRSTKSGYVNLKFILPSNELN